MESNFDDDSSTSNGGDSQRQRSFDSRMRNLCWQKADVVPGRHPERWRTDPAGNVVCRKFRSCHGCLCYEYDHIVPFSKGGQTTVENCQILQSRVNRSKSDQADVSSSIMEGYSCNLKLSDKEMDLIEMAAYGDVIRPGLHCRVKSKAEEMGISPKPKKGPTLACESPFAR